LESRRATRAAAPALTRRQHQILDHLRRREASGSHPPSLSELCVELDVVSRGSMHKQISALIAAGLIEPMARKHRGVRLLAMSASGSRQVPLLGTIAAGRPIEALPQSELIAIPESIASAPGCYALVVRGDSMRDVGILDGDVVVVEPRQRADDGEVVVALIDGGEATLKRIEQMPGEVRLHSENPAHPVQRYRPSQVAIQGVLVAQFRRYR
jgi:repressor LexA